ncbi:MAG TPA: lipopolysaccharide transport periplasmic protein LptA [Methylomirabilota bacterium]
MAALTLAALALLPGSVETAPTAPGGAPAAPKARDERSPRDGAPAPRAAKDDRTQPVTVDADKMERFGKEGLVVFTGNVVARQNNSVQYAERMEVYLDEAGDKILRTVSTGAVRIITRDCRTGTARRAEYYDLEQRVVLIGNARVWQEDNVVSGDTITIFLSQDRSVVQGGKDERVKAVFYPKDEGSASTPGASRPPATACSN